jgi:acetyl-CoA carboxylase biotin carboxylase subunit
MVEEHGFAFIGPDARAYRNHGRQGHGQENRERNLACPLFPAPTAAWTNAENRSGKIAKEMGFPVFIKAASGGGGKGMQVVHEERRDFKELSSARQREAKANFGDDTVYIEKFLTIRATSKSRFSATRMATPSIWASAIAPSSAATRNWSRKAPRRS